MFGDSAGFDYNLKGLRLIAPLPRGIGAHRAPWGSPWGSHGSLSYVLGRFAPEQEEALQPALEQAVGATECWLKEGVTTAMNQYNATD